MNKRLILAFVVVGVLAAICGCGVGAYGMYCMGLPQELADQLNANPNSSWEEDEALMREYVLSHGGSIEYDDGTVVTASGTTKPSSQPSQSAQKTETVKSETSQVETSQTETTETPEEPEEPEHEHSYRKEITTMPTCTEDGVATYTCDKCGDSYTEAIPATGHDEGEWSTEVEPTCTTAGKEVLKCTRCGEILDEREIPALGHTPGEWEVTKQADWIHDGEQIKKCTVCGEILETEVIPANHVPLYIIGGCVLAVIILIVVIVTVKKRGKPKAKKSKG